jgi:hypothetical protein
MEIEHIVDISDYCWQYLLPSISLY